MVDDQIHVLEQGCLRDEALHADVFGQPTQSAGGAVGAGGHQDVDVQRGQSSGRRAQDGQGDERHRPEGEVHQWAGSGRGHPRRHGDPAVTPGHRPQPDDGERGHGRAAVQTGRIDVEVSGPEDGHSLWPGRLRNGPVPEHGVDQALLHRPGKRAQTMADHRDPGDGAGDGRPEVGLVVHQEIRSDSRHDVEEPGSRGRR